VPSHGIGQVVACGLMGIVALSAVGCSPRAPAASAATAGPVDASAPRSSPAPSDPNNPLIGVWKLSGYSPNQNLPGVTCTISDMTYTPTQVTQTGAAGSSTTDVSYVPAGTKVYVVTNAGLSHAAAFNLLDKDTIQLDAILLCTYHRVS